MGGQESYDLVVIGSGPGGEVGAIRAAQLGLKVALVEKREHLGGTCLNVGCIPTKALLAAAKTWDKLQGLEKLGFNAGTPSYDWQRIMARKEEIVAAQRKGLRFLMKKNKIPVLTGKGRLAGPGKVTVADGPPIAAKHVLLATGSRVRQLPFAPSTDRHILTSDSVLAIDKVPKTMAVVGGGVVGMEFASLFGRFGCRVTVLEALPRILPTEDGEVVADFTKALRKQNVTVKAGTKISGIKEDAKGCTVVLEGAEPEKFDKVLISIGREPVTNDIGLEKAGVRTEGPHVVVDAHYRTSVPSVFAIGDIIKTPALAHTASAEAIHAVETIAGHALAPIDYEANPSAIYTYPEIASIGQTEEALKEAKIPYEKAKFPFAPMAKAKIEGATEGFVKLLYGPKHREILGVHLVGAIATELIGEFVLGKVLETTVDEIGLAIHPHPTISETIMEAAHTAVGGAIHM